VVREGVGAGGRNDQALYAHINNKTIKIKKKRIALSVKTEFSTICVFK
jgi:hypothetical protein